MFTGLMPFKFWQGGERAVLKFVSPFPKGNTHMVLFRVLVVVPLLLIPTVAFAWGPLTHVYLGSEVFYLGSFLPAAVLALMRKYRQDFLYGNIMADAILAKKYMPGSKNCHSWDAAVSLLESAGTDSERAFSLGYMSHLAADTVAHGIYTAGRRNLGHTILEFKADSLIDRGYWFEAVAIRKRVQLRNDKFLERSLDRVIFSFNTNKRIFKGVVALSGLHGAGFGAFVDRGLISTAQRGELETLHEESLDRILDVLKNGTRSEVLKESPLACLKRGRVLKAFLN